MIAKYLAALGAAAVAIVLQPQVSIAQSAGSCRPKISIDQAYWMSTTDFKQLLAAVGQGAEYYLDGKRELCKFYNGDSYELRIYPASWDPQHWVIQVWISPNGVLESVRSLVMSGASRPHRRPYSEREGGRNTSL